MSARRPENPIERCVGFEWDDWNTVKNWECHRVASEEAEDVFFHDPMLFRRDSGHSNAEARYQAMGETRGGRLLLVVFTVRKNLIRVISARDLNRKEQEAYRKYEKENS
ncbi:hypothetical protein HNQ77_004460 [Silvibacterium bohemicum]|uniref:BrnT family toxin n=1 Tax=Silvibacterium bohemicum TaxID=1577686 RepID=A0A841K5R3_9BACT|nr:BrnT family toxin [Silvibacterium bohemicum]MBB6146481.1 hypothetical protein [Silvibacterium bohemicum]